MAGCAQRAREPGTRTAARSPTLEGGGGGPDRLGFPVLAGARGRSRSFAPNARASSPFGSNKPIDERIFVVSYYVVGSCAGPARASMAARANEPGSSPSAPSSSAGARSLAAPAAGAGAVYTSADRASLWTAYPWPPIARWTAPASGPFVSPPTRSAWGPWPGRGAAAAFPSGPGIAAISRTARAASRISVAVTAASFLEPT